MDLMEKIMDDFYGGDDTAIAHNAAVVACIKLVQAHVQGAPVIAGCPGFDSLFRDLEALKQDVAR